MARKEYAGAAPRTTLASGINNTDLSITLASGTGYPAGTYPFVVVIDRGLATEEKVLCTSRSGATLTVDAAGRGYDSTTAQSHASGAYVEHILDAAAMTDLMRHVYDTSHDDHTQYLKDADAAGAGIAIAAGVLSVQTDNSTVEVNADTVRVKALGITAAQIAADAVTTAKILDANVTTAKITDANVTTAKIADLNVTTGKLADNAVTTAKITDANVTLAKLASEAWTTYVPTLTQSGAVTKTVTRASYVRIGRTIIATGVLSVTGTGTSANVITVSLPVTAASAGDVVGSGGVYDFDGNVAYNGIATLRTTTTVQFQLGNGAVNNYIGGTGGGFTAALASGDAVYWSITYEASS